MLRVIFDGNNTAYRCNCVTELYTRSGQRTSAILGVLNTTHSTLIELEDKFKDKIRDVIYVFDKGHSKRRTDLYPEYKSNRKSKQEESSEESKLWRSEFISQMEILNENLNYFGVKTLQIKGWEGDDLIYALSELVTSDLCCEDIVVIISTDEDFHQLVSDKVNLYSPVKKILYTSNNYEELTGIPQELFLSYKILKGDSSDGIGGIPGIGEKTAKSLVKEYGKIGEILKEKETLMKSKRTAKLFTKEGLEVINRNNNLINLNYVDYSGISNIIEEVLSEVPKTNSKRCMEFLTNYQLSSIMIKFKNFMRPFENLGKNFVN